MIGAGDLQHSAVVVGQTGSGKTQTLLRLATIGYASLQVCTCGPLGVPHGLHPYLLDPKNSLATAEAFHGLMLGIGVSADRIGRFPEAPYDIWRGPPDAVAERLLALIGLVDEGGAGYYAKATELLVHSACLVDDTAPHGFDELLARLQPDRLADTATTLVERGHIRTAATTHLPDLAMQVLQLRRLTGHLLTSGPGSWAVEDVDAAYIRLESTTHPRLGRKLAQAIAVDFPHAWTSRQPTGRRGLLIIDEAPQVLGDGAQVASMYETLRESGAAVVVAAQSYSGLGPAADRILGAAGGLLVVHATKDPEPFVHLMGTERRPEVTTRIVGEYGRGDEGSSRVTEHHPAGAQPNRIRAYRPGRATVYTGDTCAEAQIALPDNPA